MSQDKDKNKSVCIKAAYEDYESDYIETHYAMFCSNGKPEGYEGMLAYRRRLVGDLRVNTQKLKIEGSIPRKWADKEQLTTSGVVKVMQLANEFRNIVLNPLHPESSTIPCVYDFEKMKYVPVWDADFLIKEITALTAASKSTDQIKDIAKLVASTAPVVNRRCIPSEIPCETYLYDEVTKEKIEYGPDIYLLSHGAVDYDENATNPIIINPEDGSSWDFDSWEKEVLGDDEEMVALHHQILAREVRPYRPWVGAAMYVGDKGNNGKGTFIHLERQLVGAGNYSVADIKEFGERFGLTNLVSANAVLCDENDTEYVANGLSRFKAATGGTDEFSVEFKNKNGKVSIVFRPIVVQCVNALPRSKDKSPSVYRRYVPIPFEITFTGVEREYIKNDYLERPEVLAYVKKIAIETEIKSISPPNLPKRSKELLMAIMQANDPAIAFWEEVRTELVWDRVPFEFIYDLYVKWVRRNNPSGKVSGKTAFKDSFRNLIEKDPDWDGRFDQNQTIKKPSGGMPYEPLITEYQLETWYNPVYRGADLVKRATGANVKDRFRGIVRI